MLPKKVELFLYKPIVRVLRVIGGISAYIAIKGFSMSSYLAIRGYNLPSYIPLDILIYILGLIQIFQILVVCMIKLVYGYKKLRDKKEFEIRNSPYDKWASIAGKAWYCFKFGCQTGVVGMGMLSVAEVVDNMLGKGGKIFTPLIVGWIHRLDKILGKEVPTNLGIEINEWEKDITNHSNKLKECTECVKMIKEGKKIMGTVNKTKELGDLIRNSK